MQKLNFIFATSTYGRYQRNRHTVKRLTRKGIQSSMVKAAAVVGLAIASYAPVAAQCNTFMNADSANPLLPVLHQPLGTLYSVEFIDYDHDGDLDCYATGVYDNNTSAFTLFKNVGNAHHAVFQRSSTSGWEDVLFRYNGTPRIQFVDIDGDGDYDCFASETDVFGYYSVRVKFYENNGTAQSPHYVENSVKNPFQGVQPDFWPFTFADIDGDGDLDYYSMDRTSYYDPTGYKYIVQNIGTPQQPDFTGKSRGFESNRAQPDRTYFDWDGDGLLDYFEFYIGYGNRTSYYHNIGPKNNPRYEEVKDGRPVFTNGAPYRIVDLNGDGAPEVFSSDGHYSTLAPVAQIVTRSGETNPSAPVRLISRNKQPGYTYQWERNGKMIAGATSASINASKPGSYILYVTGTCGTGVSLPFTVSAATGVTGDNKVSELHTGISQNIKVTAYPNPFTHSFTVQLPTAGKSVIRITDLTGRILLQQAANGNTVTTGSTLQKGVYILQVWQDDKMVYTSKLVKE